MIDTITPRRFVGQVRVTGPGANCTQLTYKSGFWSIEYDDFTKQWFIFVKEVFKNYKKLPCAEKEIFKSEVTCVQNFPCQAPRGKTITFVFKEFMIFFKASFDNEVIEIYNLFKTILNCDSSVVKLSRVVPPPFPIAKVPNGSFSSSSSSAVEKMDISTVQAILNESPVKNSVDVDNFENENNVLTRVREIPRTIATRSEINRTPKKFTPVTETVIRVATDKENKNRTPPIHAVPSTSTNRTPLADKSTTSVSISTSHFYGKNNEPSSSITGNNLFVTVPLHSYFRNKGNNGRGINIKRISNVTTRDPKRKRLNNENDALWKPYYSSPPSKTPLLGFSNLGNTCYMNAILQAIFGLEIFTKELLKTYDHYKTYLCDDLLFSSLPQLLKYRNSSSRTTKDDLLIKVKRAISASATRFSGYSQHDAHEFLEQVLDQLKEEVKKLSEEHSSATTALDSNPIVTNLEFTVSHCIECQSCQNVIVKEENFNDLSLDLPITADDDDHPISLQKMIDKFFRTEQVQYKCELCSSDSSIIRHRFTKLPRILILHVKRYAFDSTSSTSLKSANTIYIPKFLTLHRHRDEEAKSFLDVSESTKKIVTFDEPPTTPLNQIEDFPSLASLMGSRTPPMNGSSKAKRRLYDNDSHDASFSRTSPNKRYEFRKINRQNYSDAMDVDPIAEAPEKTSVGIEEEEDEDFKKAIELSKLDASNPPQDLDVINAEDIAERSFQNEMQRAIELSLLEDVAQSGVDSVDNCSITTETYSEPKINGAAPMDENAQVETENVDVDLDEHASKGHLPDAFRLCSIVTHLGSTSNTGHYVSDVYDAKKKIWRSYDDSRVSDTTEDDVQRDRQKTGKSSTTKNHN